MSPPSVIFWSLSFPHWGTHSHSFKCDQRIFHHLACNLSTFLTVYNIVASFRFNVYKSTLPFLIIALYSVVSKHQNLAHYLSTCTWVVFYFFYHHKEGWSKHPWTYTFKYMSNYFFLGAELLGQTVCIFKIPIRVVKQLYTNSTPTPRI